MTKSIRVSFWLHQENLILEKGLEGGFPNESPYLNFLSKLMVKLWVSLIQEGD